MVEVMDDKGAKRVVRVRNALLWRPDRQGLHADQVFQGWRCVPANGPVTEVSRCLVIKGSVKGST